jgi:hypothetical protein
METVSLAAYSVSGKERSFRCELLFPADNAAYGVITIPPLTL